MEQNKRKYLIVFSLLLDKYSANMIIEGIKLSAFARRRKLVFERSGKSIRIMKPASLKLMLEAIEI